MTTLTACRPPRATVASRAPMGHSHRMAFSQGRTFFLRPLKDLVFENLPTTVQAPHSQSPLFLEMKRQKRVDAHYSRRDWNPWR